MAVESPGHPRPRLRLAQAAPAGDGGAALGPQPRPLHPSLAPAALLQAAFERAAPSGRPTRPPANARHGPPRLGLAAELCDGVRAIVWHAARPHQRHGDAAAARRRRVVHARCTLAVASSALRRVGALRNLETFAHSRPVGRPRARAVQAAAHHRRRARARVAWPAARLVAPFLPVPTIVRMLDGMAALKLNTLHWHLTTRGPTISSAAVPALAESARGTRRSCTRRTTCAPSSSARLRASASCRARHAGATAPHGASASPSSCSCRRVAIDVWRRARRRQGRSPPAARARARWWRRCSPARRRLRRVHPSRRQDRRRVLAPRPR